MTSDDHLLGGFHDLEKRLLPSDPMVNIFRGTDYTIDPINIAINSSTPGQNGRHSTDNVFKCIFVNEKFCILIKI